MYETYSNSFHVYLPLTKQTQRDYLWKTEVGMGEEHWRKNTFYMATHSNTLTWRIPWREESGRLQSMGSQRVGHDWAISHHSNTMNNYMAVRTGHETMDGFQIGKGVHQGCILSPWLFNLYAEYIKRNAGLPEAQAGIKIARRNINNFRYADDRTLWQKVKN